MSFHTSIPIQQEIANFPVYDIAMEDWFSQRYYDGINDDLSIPIPVGFDPRPEVSFVRSRARKTHKHTYKAFSAKYA